MKKYFLSFIALSLILFTACEDFNEQFSGYDELNVYSDTRNIDYVLTDADYGSIASNAENATIALAIDQSIADTSGVPSDSATYKALLALKGNKYFTETIDAGVFLPAFVKNNRPWQVLDDGSVLFITYNQQKEIPEEVTGIAQATQYTLTSEDYAAAWDGEDYAFFTPAHAPSTSLPKILKGAIAEPVAGDYAVVTYSYSENEPGIAGGGGGGEEETVDKIGDLIAAGAAGTAKVQGTVIGTYARGFLLSDGSGTILCYLGTVSPYSLGDVLTVEGETSLYAGLLQFSASATYTKTAIGSSIGNPEATAMSTSDLVAYATNPTIKYVSYTGILTISGSYYNITFEGEESIIGSISYPFSSIINPDFSGEEVTVTGYLIGVSSGKYINTLATSITITDGTPSTPIGAVALAEDGDFTVSGMVAATYARGFLLTDGSGSILVYTGSPVEYAHGDMLVVSGATTTYSGLKQFTASASIEKFGEGTLTRPACETITDLTLMDSYLTAPQVKYVKYEGTLSISGSYYNVIFDGCTAQGSISYPEDGLIDASLDGKKVTVEGYLIGVSSGKYVNTMALSVQESTASEAPKRASAMKVATSTYYALYKYSGTAWEEDDATALLQKTDYTSMGESYPDFTTTAKAEGFLPTYLKVKYPYAAAEDEQMVVYFLYASGVLTPTAVNYIFDGTEWIKQSNELEQQIATFSKNEGVWAYENRAAYLDETFLGDQGKFTIVNVELSDLSYIWQPTSSYGMKASGYYQASHEVESWFISPAVTLERDSVKLTFEHALNYLSGNNREDYVKVWITTDNYNGTDDPNSVEWKELTVPQWPDGASWTYVTSYTTDENGDILDTIDLTEYNGSTIHIAFQYIGTSLCCVTWEVKNLLLQ